MTSHNEISHASRHVDEKEQKAPLSYFQPAPKFQHRALTLDDHWSSGRLDLLKLLAFEYKTTFSAGHNMSAHPSNGLPVTMFEAHRNSDTPGLFEVE